MKTDGHFKAPVHPLVPESDLVHDVARFLLDIGYGSDFINSEFRAPFPVLEAMVELAADDPFWTDQKEPREQRLEECYDALASEIGYWR